MVRHLKQCSLQLTLFQCRQFALSRLLQIASQQQAYAAIIHPHHARIIIVPGYRQGWRPQGGKTQASPLPLLAAHARQMPGLPKRAADCQPRPGA